MLPPDQPGQNYVTISPIIGGKITLPERYFVRPFDEDARNTVPSLAFLIQRPNQEAGRTRHLLFDLGLRSTIAGYSAAQQRHLKSREPYVLGPGVAATLRQEGYEASDIGTIILSHVHYDHHGDPEDFASAQFLVGPGTRRLLRDGLASSASHQSFDPKLLPPDRLTELPEVDQDDNEGIAAQWKRLGPFQSIDLFHDGSVYVLNSPGHLPGHINLLCRTGPNAWVCLCGDSYHDRRLLTGKRDIGTWKGDDGEICCIHVDRQAAAESIAHLRELSTLGKVELVGAHDAHWLKQNQTRLFPATM